MSTPIISGLIRSKDSAEPVYTTSHKNLSKDVTVSLSNWLPIKDAIHLSQVDKFFFTQTKKCVDQRAAHILIEHIALGRLEDPIKMVKANPKLLLLKAKVNDYAGHEIIGADGTGVTAYECALGAGFYKAALMLAAEFTDENFGMNEGEAEQERLRQHKRQLPNGWIYEGPTVFRKYYAYEIAYEILKSSDPDVSAALVHKCNPQPIENQTKLRESLDAFREELTPLKTIRAGKHINHENLFNCLEALYQFVNNQFINEGDDRWTDDKTRLYSRQVLGFIERDESAILAKYFSKGLENTTYLGKIRMNDRVPSNFEFSNCNKSYFPLSKENSGLGFDYSFNHFNGEVDGTWISTGLQQTFIENLRIGIENLANPLTTHLRQTIRQHK